METEPIVKRRTRSTDQAETDCPLTAALRVIGGKWSLIVLYWLDDGRKRFHELQRAMPSISHKMLAGTLHDLEHEGLITRTVYPEIPPRVEYALSSYGCSVRPLIDGVRVWGRQHLERQKEILR
jgi:DNA-binding HxlR family transcriptional regulator